MAQLSKEGYVYELNDIKNKIIDFLEQINKGKISYFKDLSLKLRILYCYKSGTKSLIKTISDLYNFDIFVYITNTMKEKVEKGMLPASLAEGLVFEQINSVVKWFERGDELVDIFTAIEKDEVLINEKRHSYKKIIEVMSDKMGGAHIDKKVNDDDLMLHSKQILIGGLPIAQRAIYDTARSSVILIEIIINYINTNKLNMFIKSRNN